MMALVQVQPLDVAAVELARSAAARWRLGQPLHDRPEVEVYLDPEDGVVVAELLAGADFKHGHRSRKLRYATRDLASYHNPMGKIEEDYGRAWSCLKSELAGIMGAGQ